MTTPIRTAVEPLRGDAIYRAQGHAHQVIETWTMKLESANWDLEVAAPYPKSYGPNRVDSFTYQKMMGHRNLVSSFTKTTQSTRSMNDPCIVAVCPERSAKVVKEAGELASQQYDAFIAKLEKKIGKHSSAVLEGSHVWDHSFLTVQTPEGEQVWKTQMILNVSKFGKLFNQYPTRKVKR